MDWGFLTLVIIFVDLCSLIFFTIWKIFTPSSMLICSIEFDKAINIPVRPTPALVSKKFRRAVLNGCFEKIHIIFKETSAKRALQTFYVNFKKIFRTNFSKCTSRQLLMYVKITLKVIILKKQVLYSYIKYYFQI